MNSLCSVRGISSAVLLSEACIPLPTLPPKTTTSKDTTTKTTPSTTTTAPKYKCPIGGPKSEGKTCISGNVLEIVASPDSLDCNTKCKGYKDSKCKFWSFVPTRKLCFILSSCVPADGADQKGVVSGELGCKVPSKEFTVLNLIDADLTDCKIKWEPSNICPEQTFTLKKLGTSPIKYYTEPPSLGCTKIAEISCMWGSEKCEKMDINVPIPNLYVKKKLSDPTKCEIADTPKYLLG